MLSEAAMCQLRRRICDNQDVPSMFAMRTASNDAAMTLTWILTCGVSCAVQLMHVRRASAARQGPVEWQPASAAVTVTRDRSQGPSGLHHLASMLHVACSPHTCCCHMLRCSKAALLAKAVLPRAQGDACPIRLSLVAMEHLQLWLPSNFQVRFSCPFSWPCSLLSVV